ncbi:MAG: hypothetical protein ACR2O7_12415, partial [Parasphingorhabdus sp.]
MRRFNDFGGRAAVLVTGAILISLLSTPALAQAYQCEAPTVSQPTPPARKPADEPRRITPATGYTLAMSWSPEF